MVISMDIGQGTNPKADAVIFTTEGGAKSWYRIAVKSTNQRKCHHWKASSHHSEWDSHPSINKETRLRPDIMIHSSSTQQLIMVELKVT